MEIIKKYIQYIGFAGCALMIIGCFLPFISVSFFGISKSAALIGGDIPDYAINGWIIFIIPIVTAILIFLKKSKFVLIPNIIALILVIWNGVDIINQSSGLASLSVGFWIIIIGIIISSLFAFIYKEN